MANNNPDELGQAKRRDRKVYITDVAISKVPFIEYFGFTKEQSQIMQELAKGVLVISKESNDSIIHQHRRFHYRIFSFLSNIR